MRIESTTKLLIVDDLPENLQALAKIVEQDDREVFQATSGEAALAHMLEHEFALAILDVMMPGMDGFELAALMRSTDRTRHIPIIFVSAMGKELNYAFRGYEAGAVDFLHKPLDIAAVKSKVNVFVEVYQQRQEVRKQVAALEDARFQLRNTQVELEHALRMRDEFISMVAHELRTPLNTLHIEVQLRQLLLQKNDMSAFTPEKIKNMVDRDERQVRSMTRLIHDMVDVTRIQSGKLSVQPKQANLSRLLRRIVDDMCQQAAAAGCDLAFNEETKIEVEGFWDEFRLEQIIVNLLTNALRYGAGKPVEIGLCNHGNAVELKICDHGLGIAPTEHERIFQKFERVGTREVRDSLGMGLYIARQLAEAQGGTLDVTSVLGEGATFCLRLSLAKD